MILEHAVPDAAVGEQPRRASQHFELVPLDVELENADGFGRRDDRVERHRRHLQSGARRESLADACQPAVAVELIGLHE